MVTLILLALLGAAGYLISLRVHPYRKCRACGTSGRHQSRDGKSYGNCWRCQDRTLVRRGVRMLMPGLHSEIQAKKHGRFH
jgi:hypothetical protein